MRSGIEISRLDPKDLSLMNSETSELGFRARNAPGGIRVGDLQCQTNKTLSHTWPSLKHVQGVYPNIFWESDNVSITQPQVTSSPHGFLFTESHEGPLGQLEAILMMLESSKSMQKSTSCNLENGCSLLKKSTHILTGSNLAVMVNVTSECFSTSQMSNSSQNPCKSGLLNLFNSCDAMVQH